MQLLHPSFRKAAYVELPYIRICNFDVCGKCLLHMRASVLPPEAPQGSTSSVPVDDQGQSSRVLAGRGLSAPAAHLVCELRYLQ